MSAKKRSARERLLDLDPEQVVREFQSGVSFKSLSFRVRRLLRAHERELATRAVDAADLAFTEGRRLPQGGTIGGMSASHRAAALSSIRAAILNTAKPDGPQRRRK